jgi:2-hydroxy-6-oxonona-2,4-dienedioate hydrolase
VNKYRAEMDRASARVAAVPSAVVRCSSGPVEYVDAGSGTPVLFSHGVLGGHENIRDCVDAYLGTDNRAIGPSRFGYFRSAIPPDPTPHKQADAYIQLLDHLEVDRVVAVGFSAGGPSAIALALRHPDRLHGLILASSYLPGMGKPLPQPLTAFAGRIIGWERGWWLLKQRRPQLLARIMGVPAGWDPSDDAFFLAVRESLFPVRRKRQGVAFDAFVSEPMSNGFPLEDVRTPTLLVHAADDRLAPYEHAPRAATRIPSARLVTIPAGGHLFLKHQHEVRQAARAFIAECVVPARP